MVFFFPVTVCSRLVRCRFLPDHDFPFYEIASNNEIAQDNINKIGNECFQHLRFKVCRGGVIILHAVHVGSVHIQPDAGVFQGIQQ